MSLQGKLYPDIDTLHACKERDPTAGSQQSISPLPSFLSLPCSPLCSHLLCDLLHTARVNLLLYLGSSHSRSYPGTGPLGSYLLRVLRWWTQARHALIIITLLALGVIPRVVRAIVLYASGVVDTAVLRVTHIPPTPTTGRKDTTTASWGIWGTTMANTTTGWWVANRGWGGWGDTAKVTMGRGRATGTTTGRGRRGRDRVATAKAQCRA
jgi:hypothetical protein